MKKSSALTLVLCMSLAACVADSQVTVKGFADESAGCSFMRYSDGKLVESFKISGRFNEIYAVSKASGEKRIDIACSGKVVTSKQLKAGEAVVDFGEIKPAQ